MSFAIQTLAKSAKAMPVMMWGSIYSGKRYKAADYAHACVITAGCTVFIMTGPSASRVVEDEGDAWYTIVGAALMLVYLAVDGLTSTWQDGLFQRYSMSICDQVGPWAGQVWTWDGSGRDCSACRQSLWKRAGNTIVVPLSLSLFRHPHSREPMARWA